MPADMSIGISKELNDKLDTLTKQTAKVENIPIKSIKRPLLLAKMANVYERYLEQQA